MIVAALLLSTAQVAATAAPAQVAPPPASIQAVLLPAWTPVRLVTQALIDSRSAHQGQRFGLTITEDVKVGDRIVIPRSTPAVGEVEVLAQKSPGGNSGRLVLAPLFIDWAGDRIYLRGHSETAGKGAVGASVATQVLLSPLGFFISGKSATLPAGSVIEAETRNDVKVIPAP